MKWLVSLEEQGCLTGWEGVTADESMRLNVNSQLARIKNDSRGEIIIGNWASSQEGSGEEKTGFKVKEARGHLVEGRLYDTILLDYLIGAIDGFSPYYQDLILPRVKKHLKPGGRMYIVGLNPIPDKVHGKGDIVCEVRRARDAAILLAGHRCYREYPVEWITRHLASSGLSVVSTQRFPILYSFESIIRQINVGRSKLSYMPENARGGMKVMFDELEGKAKEATKEGRLRVGFDYVVAAERDIGDTDDRVRE